MGKVTTYCQISGCSPEVGRGLDYLTEDIVLEDVSEPTSDYNKVREALRRLSMEDESRGTQALSIIGPIGQDNRPIWQFEENPNTLDEILAEAEGHVRELPGCCMGGMFDMGYCEGPNGDDGALVSYGGYFFVQTMMLAILAGATQGRVSVQRLWRLAMMKGHFDAHNHYVLPGVDYGPIHTYLDQFPWYLGDVAGMRELIGMEKHMDTAEDIAEVLRKRGFWMWMRPDRFPIDVTTPRPTTDITEADLIAPISHETISKLPPEIVRSVALELNIRDIIALATLNKTLYYRVLGNQNTRDSLARAYIYKNARWCLPYGETELRWWNERKGDDALGWDYLRRCSSESHSMRNRRRIWSAAKSIEAECEREEAKFGIRAP